MGSSGVPKASKKPAAPKQSRWLQLTARQVGVYNNWDCLSTARLAKLLPIEMDAKAADPDYYAREVWPTVEVVLAMQRRGLAVDTLARENLRQSMEAELRDTDDTIQHLAIEAGQPTYVNLNSHTQKAKLLFDKLGLKPRRFTEKSGTRSTDLEALAGLLHNLRVMDRHAIPVLHGLFHRSRVNTILSRYLDFYVRDGRVYPRIKFCGTKTERLAYADPAVQQFPPEVRGMVVAAPGHVLVSADFSQLEARILAVLAHDKPSLEAFAAGQDIHSLNATDLFGRPITKDDPERDFAKSFLYGISYGGAAETMKSKLFCPCPKCVKPGAELAVPRTDMRRLADRWFARHPAVLAFRRQLADTVRKFHYYDSPFGGRRWIFSPWSVAEREVYNLPMQWSAATIVNRAMRRLHTWGAPIVFQHHDSIMLEAPVDQTSWWASRLRLVMEQPVPELGGTVFPVEVSVAERWSEL